MECLGRYTFFVMTPSAAFREALSLASRSLQSTAPGAKKQEMPKPGARQHKRITTCQENAKTKSPPTEAIQTTAGHEPPG